MPPFTIQRRIEFRDTDAAGIAHFSTYFTFMEEAEHELLRSIGTSVIFSDAEGQISWPRVSVACEYRGALRFEDVFEIQVVVERMGEKSVSYLFEFVKDHKEVARGRITAVCCRLEHGLAPRSIKIPPDIAEKLGNLIPAAEVPNSKGQVPNKD